ncbi:DUF817 domain-containing protein [Paenibacillus thiaminolyticus]|uniref:DUF817 domain-containing protein n=1 Tax=Paenibacillus thiaminolyticus TaxID=49283 RepID=A0AAP9DXW7_PANTH|nr:DUF817 domain-containing protein [Paenibacillus thiaminolyticus]MCY9534182.1 DUF817 domain-containing protein [Paenibacillus thiaminolyticus]MCY9604701.1 DUF817 domain-containing protein [Paenibacillus thiaminolyticus]MCY9610140.1 DUF817 domain-containing protein [Paenibacillus thiaminolyticus]MCY9614649.1 DUF817 domain-containing protein [Paenibacillus thiaminolyticus]MCY9621834.1 DUF817 domain-containing protein [Paenibacillus thiaminolyticus]
MAFKLKSFVEFGWQQALSCLFPAIIFAALALARVIDIPYIPAYDFMLLICLAVQIIMIRSRLETMDELKVICVFHLIGLVLEIYKVHMGSWAYPLDGWTKVFGVPLYSGFMYASVASYLCQAWRRLQVKLHRYPKPWCTVPLGAAIYLNFMTHHFIYDLRWVLTILLFAVFFRTYVEYTVLGVTRRMPLVLSFALIGFFIWVAENIGTFLGAWRYPHQANGWNLVQWGKFSSWFLLVIVSFMIVAQLKHVKEGRSHRSHSIEQPLQMP